MSRPATQHPAAVVALLAVLALACPGPAAAQAPVATADYRLGPRDGVKIEVFEVPELNAERRVGEDGTITLPVLGSVQAAGLTAGELADAIQRRLEADYVNRATVRVELTEVLSQTVTVLGAVANPGALGHPGSWTLLEALSAAGGLTADHGAYLRIQRRAANGLSDQVSIPIADLVERADPSLNLPVFPDDLINVERTRTVTVYLLGEVATTGALQLKSTDALTLLTVIAQAGGLTDRASPRLRVKRRDADGLMQEIQANYKRILEGEEPDLELQDGDLVVVKESFF
jgi:polysaccharide export outer membrane protein